MKGLLISIFAVTICDVRADLINIGENLMGGVFENIQTATYEADVDIFSNENFYVSAKYESQKLSESDIEDDPYRLDYYLKNKKNTKEAWAIYRFEARLGVPFSIAIPELDIKPLSLTANYGVGKKYFYEFILNAPLEAKKVPIKAMIAGATKATWMIKSYTNIDYMVEKYAEGFEIKKSGTFFMQSGVSSALPIVTPIDASLYSIKEAPVEVRLKLLRKKPFPLFDLQFIEQESIDRGSSLNVGRSDKLFTYYILNGKLAFKFANFQIGMSNKETVTHHFLVELKTPDIKRALVAALKGDVRALEQKSVFRTGSESYAGVILLEKKINYTDQIYKKINLGPRLGGGIVTMPLRWLKIHKFLKSIFSYSSSKESTVSIESHNMSYDDQTITTRFRYDNHREKKLLWGALATSNKDIVVDVGVRFQNTIHQLIAPDSVLEISYNSKYSGKNMDHRLHKKMLESIDENKLSLRCQFLMTTSDRYQVEVNATILEQSMERVNRLTPDYIWYILADELALSKPEMYQDAKLRAQLLRWNTGPARLSGHGPQKYKLPKKEQDSLDLVVRLGLIDDLMHLKTYTSKFEVARAVRDIFEKWNGNSLIFSLIQHLYSSMDSRTSVMKLDYHFRSSSECDIKFHGIW